MIDSVGTETDDIKLTLRSQLKREFHIGTYGILKPNGIAEEPGGFFLLKRRGSS